MKQQTRSSKITVGLDLGEHRHRYCALDAAGQVMEEGNVANERKALAKLSARYRGAVGIHGSRHAQSLDQ